MASLKQYVAVVCISLAVPFQAAAATCAMEKEKAALDVRALQTQLMVAALSCGEQQRYNTFMKKFGSQLSEQGNGLKRYFSRVYHGNEEQAQNSFVTQLANVSSELSLEADETVFCNTASKLFDDVIGAKPTEMPKLALNAGVDSLHGIDACH